MASSDPSLLVRYGNFLFRWRNLVFPLVMLAIFVGFPPLYPFGSPVADDWVDIAGIELVLLGELLRIAVVGLEYIKRGGRDKKVYAETLVTGGLFAHCRNPLYVGNLLILAGMLLIHGNPWAIGIGLVFFLPAYAAIVAAEERFLAAKFADYEAYRHSTPRWAVRFKGLGRTLSSMRFNWARVVLKEYPTLTTNICTILLLFSYEAVVFTDLAESEEVLVALGAAIVAVLAASAMARVAKKRKLLRDTPA